MITKRTNGLRRVASTALMAAVAIGALGAQQATAPGAIVGRVTRAGDTSSIPGVEIEIVGANQRARSDTNGRFRIVNVSAGHYDIRARRLGFHATVLRVSVSSGRVTAVDFVLPADPTKLVQVTVNGRRVQVHPRYAAVYERAARGWGRLFTRDDIEQMNPSELKSLLATLPAVQVNDRGVTFQRCQSDLHGLNATLSSGQAGGGGRGAQRRPGHVQVYVDGHRLTWTTHDQTAEADADRVLSRIHPSTIETMEVYTGVARIPPEFMSDACAAIVIWTKAY